MQLNRNRISASKAVQNLLSCTTLLTLLMKTAESMLSRRPVLRITVTLFFLPNYFHFIGIVFVFRCLILHVLLQACSSRSSVRQCQQQLCNSILKNSKTCCFC